MTDTVSKSRFQAQALEFFRQVERTGKPVVITNRGTPVLKLVPYRDDDPDAAIRVLRGSVLQFQKPTEPLAAQGWDSVR